MTDTLASNVVQITQPTFEEFWALVPMQKRIDKAMCRVKFAAITSERGLTTKNLDKDSGEYVEVHLQATAAEILRGWLDYCRENATPDTKWNPPSKMKLKEGGRFMRRPSTWLNRGGVDAS